MLKRLKIISKFRERLRSIFNGWKIRQIVNSLANEIQDYVNCDIPLER